MLELSQRSLLILLCCLHIVQCLLVSPWVRSRHIQQHQQQALYAGSGGALSNNNNNEKSKNRGRSSSGSGGSSSRSSSSMGGSGLEQQKASTVFIEAPSMNSRRISASILVNGDIDQVWSILTDYERLSIHVPNLVQSYRLPSPTKDGIRLFQEGAQKIIGFTFRASLTMDMVEEAEDESRALRERCLSFKLVDSAMFSSFDGSWMLKYHSRVRELDAATGEFVYTYRTLLTYSVYVRPKGPVPVAALEWRIREDVPVNLFAMKVAAEKLGRGGGGARKRIVQEKNDEQREQYDWADDETLSSYLRQPIRPSPPIPKVRQQSRGLLSSTDG